MVNMFYTIKYNYINYYLCLDIYFLGGEDYRLFAFCNMDGLAYETKMQEIKFRYNELTKLLSE